MSSAPAPSVLRLPAPPPPLPSSSKSETLASLLAEEQFNLYYLLAILFPVLTAILGEFGRKSLRSTFVKLSAQHDCAHPVSMPA